MAGFHYAYRHFWIMPCVLALLWACAAGSVDAQQTTLRSSTVSGGGSVANSGDRALTSVVGQASPVGLATAGSYRLGSGFLHTLAVEPPLLEVDHPEPVAIGAEVMIEARIAGGANIQSARLWYRPGDASSYSEVEMTTTGNRVQGTIPSDAVTDTGIAYHIEAIDIQGRSIRVPTAGNYSVRVLLPEEGLVRADPIPGGTDEAAYRIISVPIDLENKDPEAVFGDDLGSYDPTRWRFFQLGEDGEVFEYPNTGPMEPGSGFWLISRDGGEVSTGPGTTVSLESAFSIELLPGWNLIGNPFNYPIPLENLLLQSGQELSLRTYSAAGYNQPLTDPVNELEPFEGYAVLNRNDRTDVLLIDPDVAVEEPSAREGALVAEQQQALDWLLQINARAGSARSNAAAGVSSDASDDWGPLDHPVPPHVGRFVSAEFYQPDWDHPSEHFSSDVRPHSSSGHSWPLQVRTNMTETITLSFSGMEQVPDDFEAWLLDERANVVTNLRATNRYEAADIDADAPLPLRLVVGTRSYVESQLGELPESAAFEMDANFPNPFTRSTTIRYGIPEEGPVTMYVYDTLGRRIATLVDQVKSAGYHTAVWDGYDRGGTPVASGTYFVRLVTGDHVQVQGVTVVR